MLYKNEILIDESEFLAMLAHDMKTPVKAQVTALKLLHAGAFGEISKEADNIILNIMASNKYLQLILDNVLGDYRLHNGKVILNKTQNDIRKTVEEVIKNIGILFESKEQSINVNYSADNFVKSYDEIEIQRVLINLLSNAFEYAQEGSLIDIIVKNVNDNLRVEIRSKTQILSEENQAYFKKISTGLGLNICKKILDAHDGYFCTKKSNGVFLTEFEIP